MKQIINNSIKLNFVCSKSYLLLNILKININLYQTLILCKIFNYFYKNNIFFASTFLEHSSSKSYFAPYLWPPLSRLESILRELFKEKWSKTSHQVSFRRLLKIILMNHLIDIRNYYVPYFLEIISETVTRSRFPLTCCRTYP